MRYFVCGLALVMAASPAWSAPLPAWQPDKSYDAGPTGPEVDNGPYQGWILKDDGALNRGYSPSYNGEPAWHDDVDGEKLGYELDKGQFALDPNKPLWIEWRYQKDLLGFLGQNHDHDRVRLEVKLGGHKLTILHDGVPGLGDGSLHASNFNILDGSGSPYGFGGRLDAPIGEWHTLSIYIVPGTISQSGLLEAEISVDGGTDLDGTQTVGNNNAWMFGTSSDTSSDTDIRWMRDHDRDSLMATNHFYWTQVPEPTVLTMLLAGSLGLVLRRKRA
jgi:hypothetical protein